MLEKICPGFVFMLILSILFEKIAFREKNLSVTNVFKVVINYATTAS